MYQYACGCSTTARAPAFQAGDAGSIPVIRSMQLKKLYYLSFFSPFLQLCARCILRRCIGHTTKTQYAGIAQSVEQLICNQQVGGSSPSTSSNPFSKQRTEYGGIPEWPKGTDCKSAAYSFGGSNPPSPTNSAPILVRSFFCFAGK